MGFNKYITMLPKISIVKSLYYSCKFKAFIIIGKGTVLDLSRNSKIIVNDGILKIGVHYNLPQNTVLQINKNGSLVVNGDVSFSKGSKIEIGKDAILQIGNHSFINEHSRIKCSKKIVIGDDCAISWGVNIVDSDTHKIVINGEESISSKDVKIGNKVWIGFNSIILKGVSIGNGSVVGAGSVVTKDIPNNCIGVGNPAKIIAKDVDWKL